VKGKGVFFFPWLTLAPSKVVVTVRMFKNIKEMKETNRINHYGYFRSRKQATDWAEKCIENDVWVVQKIKNTNKYFIAVLGRSREETVH